MSVRWFVIDDDGGSDAWPQCYFGDPLPEAPDWDLLVSEILNPQVDLYGFLGFPSGKENDDPVINSTANWDVCPFVDYCDGPEFEGITQPMRYTTRWTVQLQPTPFGTQNVVYGYSGGTLVPANPLLFPAPLTADATWISIGFDGNALAGFAFQYDNAGTPTVEIRRLIAGVPTTFTWAGISPRLFFDGILQRDPALTDLVCFYVNLAGQLCGRFQRENMAIEHVLGSTGLGGGIINLTKTDREQSYQRIYYIAGDGTLRMYRSAVYPPFPEYAEDLAEFGFAATLSGDYLPGVVITGPYSDFADFGFEALSGAYVSSIIPSGPYQDFAELGFEPLNGSYPTLIILGGTYADFAELGFDPLNGTYPLVVVSGGNYMDFSEFGFNDLSGTYA